MLRKLSPEQAAEIGASSEPARLVAGAYGVTVDYVHTLRRWAGEPGAREAEQGRARECTRVRYQSDPEFRERRRNWARARCRERYHSDPEYRERALAACKRWQAKKKAECQASLAYAAPPLAA